MGPRVPEVPVVPRVPEVHSCVPLARAGIPLPALDSCIPKLYTLQGSVCRATCPNVQDALHSPNCTV